MRKRKANNLPDPDFLTKQKKALQRRHRQVIYLNDSEMAAVREYCSRYGITARSSIFREAAMERILSQLDDSHPTLF